MKVLKSENVFICIREYLKKKKSVGYGCKFYIFDVLKIGIFFFIMFVNF